MAYRIIPLNLGEFPRFDQSSLLYRTNPGKKLRAPITAWLIQGEGINVLVDTGPPGEEWSKKYHHEIEIKDGQLLEQALAKNGLSAGDIECVILTHLHWDHVHGNHLFPNVPFYVQKAELVYALDPLPVNRGGYESFQAGFTPPWYATIPQMKLVEGDREIYKGITLIALPSHTPGSQGVLVETAAGRYLIAGDCIGSYDNWNGNQKQKHILGGSFISMYDYYASYEKIEQLKASVLPSHDMQVFDQAVYG